MNYIKLVSVAGSSPGSKNILYYVRADKNNLRG